MSWIKYHHKHLPIILLSLLLLTACQGVESYSARIIFGGEHQLEREVAVDGDLIVLDGQVGIAGGGRVTGSVYMVSGSLSLDGSVAGDVTVLDGSLRLGPGAIIDGDLNLGSSDVSRHPDSLVRGTITETYALPTEWVRQAPTFSEQVRSSLLQMALMILLALFLRRFFPRPLERIKRALQNQLLVSVTVGGLSAVVGLVLFVQLAFTMILIPVSIAGLAVMFLMVAIGWIAAGAWLSERVRPRLPGTVPPTLTFAISVGLISIAIDTLRYVPIVGAPLVLISASAGIGAALLTRFGLQTYTPTLDDELL